MDNVVGWKPTQTLIVLAYVEHQFRHHEVSILISGGIGVGLCFGCCPRRKVSMMRMLLPQQGHGYSGAFGSWGWALVEILALAALMSSSGMSGTASSSRIRSIFLARV